MNLTDQLLKHAKLLTGKTSGQLGQDVLALCINKFKNNGYFVEFGAGNGKLDSNTFFLEKEYNWTGILIEPGKIFHQLLSETRSCVIDHRAITDASGNNLTFKEIDEHLGLSGLTDFFHSSDWAVNIRNKSQGMSYTVDTVSLNDLLSEYDAPDHIDYISADTEGSEYAILKNFDFKKYKVNLFTIEHNHVNDVRNNIKSLMETNGYTRILTELSQFDDWYINNDLLDEFTF